jgi:hypothetical protein
MRSFLTVAAVLGFLAAGLAPASVQFYGPGPWCAVVNVGMGNMQWDCQYWSVQQWPRTWSPVIAGFVTRTQALCRVIEGIDRATAISA